MITFDDLYKIGRVGKPHGVHGEVQLLVDDDVFDRTDTPYIFIEVDGLPVPFFFESYRFRGSQSALAVFEGIDSEQAARRLTGSTLWFERRLADADADDTALPALVGYTITDEQQQQTVGTIVAINDTTINVLFEVETPDHRQLLIPVAEEWITDIDTDRRTVSMHLPEGLTDL
ncbi:MAG: 16S rRNA processing protein RimM [Bacteroidaceae bacterium]|nr:16S rRNA processing protein RimM [Bacteroidaceae bacterium]